TSISSQEFPPSPLTLPYIPESAAINKILTNLSSKLQWSNNFKSFLEERLRYNPDHRPSAKELLRHLFL
ncbi:hypothetical protein XENTR_v10018708, partial [Xenopus tropicalis]